MLKTLVHLARDPKFDLFDRDLWGMDAEMFRKKRDSVRTYPKEDLVPCSVLHIQMAMFPQIYHHTFQNITEEQMVDMIRIMNFLLINWGNRFMSLLLQMVVVLLGSNRKADCEAWMREHASKMVKAGPFFCGSIFELVHLTTFGHYSKARFVKLLIRHGKVDRNALENAKHILPHRLSVAPTSVPAHATPSEDKKPVAELMVNNGAHMETPGVKHENIALDKSADFVQSQKSGSLKRKYTDQMNK